MNPYVPKQANLLHRTLDVILEAPSHKTGEPLQTEAKIVMGLGTSSVDSGENEYSLLQENQLEPYIDGPEINANVVMIDGRISFFEIADDFPKMGDHAANASFAETAMVLPTGLSAREINVTKESLHQTLLRQGFRARAFHCEGRVRHSTKTYASRGGLVDLYPNDQIRDDKEPSFYLHEVNAKPGGYFGSIATLFT